MSSTATVTHEKCFTVRRPWMQNGPPDLQYGSPPPDFRCSQARLPPTTQQHRQVPRPNTPRSEGEGRVLGTAKPIAVPTAADDGGHADGWGSTAEEEVTTTEVEAAPQDIAIHIPSVKEAITRGTGTEQPRPDHSPRLRPTASPTPRGTPPSRGSPPRGREDVSPGAKPRDHAAVAEKETEADMKSPRKLVPWTKEFGKCLSLVCGRAAKHHNLTYPKEKKGRGKKQD